MIAVLNAGWASTDSDESASRLSMLIILFNSPFTVNSFTVSHAPFLSIPIIVYTVEHIHFICFTQYSESV